MILLAVLLMWCLASCVAAPFVGRMIARNHGTWTEPAVVLVPMERRPLQERRWRARQDPR